MFRNKYIIVLIAIIATYLFFNCEEQVGLSPKYLRRRVAQNIEHCYL